LSTSRTEMAALVDRHLAAEDVGDLDDAVAVYTHDVEHDVVGAPGGPLRGPAAARQRYAELLEQVRSDELVEVRRFYGDDHCVVEHECAATVLGTVAGLAGRGRRVRFRMLHVFEFHHGLISRENVWMDTAGLAAQLVSGRPRGAAGQRPGV
jgi:steroid delta-isomerase-like uncharacterized protein